MKNIMSLTTMILFIAIGYGQTENGDRKRSTKIQVIAGGSYSYEELYITPGIGLEFGRHDISAGPLFWNHYLGGMNPVGFFAGYSYEPNLHYKRLSTFIQLHIQKATYPNRYNSIEPQFGYGIQFEALKNFYLRQSFSAGFIYFWRNRPYPGDHLSGTSRIYTTMLRLGIHYNINL